MNSSSQVQIDRAKELLRTVRHAAMATVNADGTPHNTPFFLILDPELKRVYFGSHPHSVHSQNVVRTGTFCGRLLCYRAGRTLYESREW